MCTTVNEMIFLRLLACSAVVAINLFAMELISSFSMEVLVGIFNIGTIVALTFIHCYYAENITEALLDVGDAFYNSEWYKGSLERNKAYLLFPIQRSQHEFRLVSFELIECSLPVFVKVGQWNEAWPD